MRLKTHFLGLMAALAATPAMAQELETIGKPTLGGTGFQTAATELARDLQWLEHMLMWIIVPIVILVVALLLVVILRFNRKSNPKPATFTHNSPLEVAWTIVPILILLLRIS